MSNFLAIATVTATLGQLLRSTLPDDVSGATVTTLRPDAASPMPTVGVNAYLYQVMPNAALRNSDLPTRRAGGELIQAPRAALDLHYLLTVYGNEAELEPQRVLGSVVRTLHAQPLLSRQLIRATINNSTFSFLADSNLADDIESVRFSPLPLTLEELSKLWSVLLQTTYVPSIAYVASVVLIEKEESVQAALPVRERAVYAVSFRRIVLERVRSETGPGAPILAGGRIVLEGRALRGEDTVVTVDETEITPAVDDLGDTAIRVALPAGLRAGIHGVQVLHRVGMGSPPAPHRVSESNQAAFALQPAVARKGDGTYDITVTPGDSTAKPPVPPRITVKVNPNVEMSQKTALLLNQIVGPDEGPPQAYTFPAAPFPKGVTETGTLVFPVPGAEGDYLVRVTVDRATSPLDVSDDPANPVYNGPKVSLP